MFENRAPRSYDYLLTLSEEARREGASRLNAFLRTLPQESGKAIYKEQATKVRSVSVKVGASYKGQNDFKRTLPQGLIGIRRIVEPGKLTDEFQVLVQPLEVTVLEVDYDYAKAILGDGSTLTFPPVFVASEAEISKVKEELDAIIRDI